MKKYLLVLTSLLVSCEIFAQKVDISALVPLQQHKTTAESRSAWYSYTDVLLSPYVSTIDYHNIYDDSTVQFNGNTGLYNNNLFGLGVSFDPASTAFSSNAVNQNFAIHHAVQSTDGYSIDSILVVGKYFRNVNFTDTLYIEILAGDGKTDDCYLNNSKSADAFALLGSKDSVYRYATAKYDWTINSLSGSAQKVMVTKILDDMAYVDTIHKGVHAWKLPLPQKINVTPNGKVIAYLHFKSGQQTVPGTSFTQANYWSHPVVSLNGIKHPSVLKNDYNSGLIVSTAERYHTPEAAKVFNSNTQQEEYIVPGSYLYENIHVFNPYFVFHVEWNSTLNIPTSKNNGMKVYPNPVKDNLVIEGLSKEYTVKITDCYGHTIFQKNITSGREEFDFTGKATGLYFIHAVDKQGKITIHKLFKAE